MKTIYPKRKNIRLDRVCYFGPIVASITICFYQKLDVICLGLSDDILAVFREIERNYSLVTYAYCLMPDHFHALIYIENPKFNLLNIIKHFKSLVSIRLKSKFPTKQLFQDRFYDHILRKDEDVFKQARYILENPVRRGLTKDFLDYRYSGGIYFEQLREFQRR
ncbi:MAG: transposase [Endomicrobia bacterium]|nr:transposase [Endomicrobiia bacterium]